MGFVATVAVLVSAPVLAANPDRARFDGQYGVLDSNRDGRYTLEEIRAAYPDLTPKEYADLDANLDGRVTRDELGLTTDRPGGR